MDSNNVSDKSATKSRDQEFGEAVDRVYRKYGPDLTAFVKDVQRDLQKVNFAKISCRAEQEPED